MKKVANYNISLKVFLKNVKWEILILKTPDSSSFHGKYDFPGGRIDEDEFNVPLLDILKREIEEEIWWVSFEIYPSIVAVARHVALAEFTSKWIPEYLYYNFWEGSILDENIQISHEHDNFKWVKLEEINLEEYFESGMLEAAKNYINYKKYNNS